MSQPFLTVHSPFDPWSYEHHFCEVQAALASNWLADSVCSHDWALTDKKALPRRNKSQWSGEWVPTMSGALNQHSDEQDRASIIAVVYQPFPAFCVVLCRTCAGLTVQVNQRGDKRWIRTGFEVLQDVAFRVDNWRIKLVSSIRNGRVIWLRMRVDMFEVCALKWSVLLPYK